MVVNKEYLAIPNEFDKLVIGLRTAYAKDIFYVTVAITRGVVLYLIIGNQSLDLF